MNSNKEFYELIKNIFTVIISLLVYMLVVAALIMLTNKRISVHTSAHIDRSSKNVTIVIDPGHGGLDGGAVSETGICEKDINLKIAIYLSEFLRLSDVECILTRSDDIMLEPEHRSSSSKKRADLIARTEIANRYDNGIFISIHQNKFPNSRYRGLQVFYSKNHPESSKLATVIKENNNSILDFKNERCIKPSGKEIYVLDTLNIPAVLIECGFLSNADELELLTSEKYQKELAFMLYTSVMKYLYEK